MTIQDKISNIDLIVEDIKKQPQTYDTILKGEIFNLTYQRILRRKINSLIENGMICKAVIPGSRFGKLIFYTIPKDYHILFEADRPIIVAYYFFKYTKIDKFYIELGEHWILKGTEWIYIKDKKMIFEGNVLLWL
jgi:hypothetical protein